MLIAGQERAVALSQFEGENGTAATNVQRQLESYTAADWPKTFAPPRLRPGGRSHDAAQRRDEVSPFTADASASPYVAKVVGSAGTRRSHSMIRALLGDRQRHLQVLAVRLISWQAPNRTRFGIRIAAAQAESDAAFARFDGTVLTALRETESGLTVYARDLDRVAALREASGQAGKAARDAETLFRAGRTGFLPVLDAQRTAIGADQTLAAAESRLVADQVQIFLALGGGWQT